MQQMTTSPPYLGLSLMSLWSEMVMKKWCSSPAMQDATNAGSRGVTTFLEDLRTFVVNRVQETRSIGRRNGRYMKKKIQSWTWTLGAGYTPPIEAR